MRTFNSFKEYLAYLDEINTELASVISEGIDIDFSAKTVKFNPSHEKGVNTNPSMNPKTHLINEIEVTSIFQRNKLTDADGNPLIHALKGNNGWKIDDKSILELFKNFLKISKTIKLKYDTIISVHSSSSLNNDFLHRLNKIIKAPNQINDLFSKVSASNVLSDGLEAGMNPKETEAMLRALRKMEKNGDYFTYKKLPLPLRKYISTSSYIDGVDSLKYSDIINGKDILILDDTISSGKTISDNVNVLMKTFEPKSIQVITLFGTLKRE